MNLSSRWQSARTRLAIALFALLIFTTATQYNVQAEIWTDSTGKHKIDAEFAGVKGSNVVLRLTDGTTKEVPIALLSTESRGKAKQLYEAAKMKAPPAATSPAKPAVAVDPRSSPAAGSSSTTREQPDFAPPVPSVPDMPAFPESMSLQETVDFIKTQVLAGHPEVFWYALPDDLRNEVDSAEVREIILPSIKAQVDAQKPIRNVAMKVCEILIRQKQFVLNCQMMSMAPPQLKPTVESVYDPASGLVYEFVSCVFDSEMAMEESISAFVNHYGPRIGGHLRQLSESAPPGMIDQFTRQIVVNQIDDQSGTITVPDNAGGTTTVEMVAYRGRWMPKEFVDKWGEKKGTMASEMKKQFEENEKLMEASQQQMSVAITMIAGTADQILQPMLDANTQQEFDAAVTQAMTMAAMFQGNGAPGLAPAPGARNPGF